jgi:chemotaxis signal transduction protein
VAEPEIPPFDPIDEPDAPDPLPEAAPRPADNQASQEEPFSIDSLELPSITDLPADPAPASTSTQIPDELFSLDLLNTVAPAEPEVGALAAAPAAGTESVFSDAAPLRLEPPEAAGAAAPADERGTQQTAEPQSVVRQGVRIGPLRLLLEFAATSQLSEPVPITPLPAMPHGLRGVASLHGNVLPVFDLASLSSVTRGDAQREMLLVVGHGESAAAVLIDGLPDRFRLSEADRSDRPAPDGWLADCMLSGYVAGGETWLDIDHRRLLDRLEASLRAPQG